MSAPVRLNVDPDATFRARHLLAAAARPRPMAPAERARSIAHAHKLATASVAPAALGGIALWKGAAAVAIAGVVLAGASAARGLREPSAGSGDRAPVSVSLSPAAPSPDVLAPPAQAVPAAVPMPHPGPTAAPPAAPIQVLQKAPLAIQQAEPQTSPPKEGDSLQAEMRLLDAASLRIKTHPVAALDLVDLHARRFPEGRLVAEREVLAVEALRRLDRAEEAHARAQKFLARSPDSIYRGRIEEIVGPAP